MVGRVVEGLVAAGNPRLKQAGEVRVGCGEEETAFSSEAGSAEEEKAPENRLRQRLIAKEPKI